MMESKLSRSSSAVLNTDEEVKKLEEQFERLDKESNGKLQMSELLEVVKKFGSGWELEDMLGLLHLVSNVARAEKGPSSRALARNASTPAGHLVRKFVKTPGQTEHFSVDFASFKVLAMDDSLVTDQHSPVVNSDVKLLRKALKEEANHFKYMDDGHLQENVPAHTDCSGLRKSATMIFEVVPPVVIAVNIVVIGLSVDLQKRDGSDSRVWQVLEWLFLFFYFLEASGKIGVFGCLWYFCGPDRWWNIFDFFCLCLSLADLAIYVYVLIAQVEHFFDLQTLMLVKMLRLARLARLVRALRFQIFYELKLMVLGVISGMRVLAWAMVLLAIMIYSAAIATTSMFGDNVPELQTVTKSMFTLFRCFTDGCVAYDGTPLSEKLHEIYGMSFVIPYVFLFVGVTLGLFNLIMAIFIDNVMANQMQRKLQEISNSAKHVEIEIKEQLLRLTLQSKSNGVPEDIETEIISLDDRFKNHTARVRAKFDLLIDAEVIITKAAFLSWLTDANFLKVLKEADIETANQSGIYEVLDADMSNSLSIQEVYVGLMRPVSQHLSEKSVRVYAAVQHVHPDFDPEDERAYKAQFHRLDKAANGRLEQEDLLAVMQTFSHGWELENVEDLLKQVNQLTGGHTSPGGHGHSRSNLRTPHESIDLDGFVALMSSEELINGKDMKSSTKRDTKFLREALQAENNHNLYKDDGHWVQGGKHQHKGPHGKLAILVDVIPGIVIVLNALVLGLSSDIAEDHIVWQVCNTFFLVFYTLEFLVKIGVFGWRWFFLGNEWPWNAFDVFCLVLSYLEEMVTWILRSTEGQVADLNTIVFIRMLRLTRLVRLVRTLRFEIFYELKTMVLGVASGMRVLFWAMVLLLVIIYTTGVAAKNVFGEAEPEFETVPAAMFTLFRCFTDGCTAYDGTPLMERLRPKYGILFVISYVFMFMLVCLGVFNLIMAIFLENVMVNQLQRKLMGIDHSANRIEVNLKEDLLRLLLRSKSNGVPEARSCGGLGGRWSHMT
ncbi:unnamed protein product [Effrenium voratum]|nr:unnamed protein product [Effrenium voratum]